MIRASLILPLLAIASCGRHCPAQTAYQIDIRKADTEVLRGHLKLGGKNPQGGDHQLQQLVHGREWPAGAAGDWRIPLRSLSRSSIGTSAAEDEGRGNRHRGHVCVLEYSRGRGRPVRLVGFAQLAALRRAVRKERPAGDGSDRALLHGEIRNGGLARLALRPAL